MLQSSQYPEPPINPGRFTPAPTLLADAVGGEPNSTESLTRLVQLGYIWGDAAEGYLSGIPSLMDYVESRANGMRNTLGGIMGPGV